MLPPEGIREGKHVGMMEVHLDIHLNAPRRKEKGVKIKILFVHFAV